MRWIAMVPLLGIVALSGTAQEPKLEKPVVDFQKDVVPIFVAKCDRCHGDKQKQGGLDMRTIPALLKGGISGPAMAPGKSEKSLMVDMMHFNEMPPKKEKNKVTKEELDRIKAWIDGGANESKK